MERKFVIHYSEVALKGKNRPEFVRLLRRNISRSLSGLDHKISNVSGRFVVTTASDPQAVSDRISKVFGVAWFAQVTDVDPQYDSIRDKVVSLAKDSPSETFSVRARRSDKSFPLSSPELASRLGAEVQASTGKKVDLEDPGLTIRVDVTQGHALLYASKTRGPGGLPVGSAGRVIHLFSGGIDSPPAAWLLMKRGCTLVYLHFYLAPTPEYPLASKVPRLVRDLASYGGKSTLVLIPFADYQLATMSSRGDLEPSLFRRFMRMTAEALSPHFEAAAISTGDSLSQAASQTVWNLGTFDSGSSLPILRPLLGYDKEEVISLARRIGTYEASLEDYKDCCAIITRHPKTRTSPQAVSELADSLGFPSLVARSISRGTLVSFDPATGSTKVAPLAEALRLNPQGDSLKAPEKLSVAESKI